MKKLLLKLALPLAATLCLVTPARAIVVNPSPDERITLYDVKMDIDKDSVANVTEEITYDFGSTPRHGIERYVPTTTKIADSSKYNNYNFKLDSVSFDGHETQVLSRTDGYYKYIRLGDPNVTVPGEHKFVIKYQISPVMARDNGGDFLNWNLVGDKWPVPIAVVHAQINFPKDVEVHQSKCFTGRTGSTTEDCSIIAINENVQVKTQLPLSPHEGLTARLLVSQNAFSSYLVEDRFPSISFSQYYPFVLLAALLIPALLYLFIIFALDKIRKKRRVVIAEYEPPDDLGAAEIGFLEDSAISSREISATIIDLAVKKCIKINQIVPKSMFKAAKYEFTILKATDNKLRDYEKSILELIVGAAMEQNGEQVTKLVNISQTQASSVTGVFFNQVKYNIEKKGYFKPKLGNADKRFSPKNIIIISVVVIMLITASISLGGKFAIFYIFIAASIFGAKRIKLTKSGYDEWAKIEGFKLFLSVTEKDRMKFSDAPAKNPEQFSKFLPYAVAMGVEKEWAKQFESLDMRDNLYWYGGTGNYYSSVFLASSLSTDFGGAINTSITPTSSGGGFSGGGFSGGGGGGGGGGSW